MSWLADPPPGSPEDALAMEAQAIARAHRIGQRKHIEIVRFFIRGSLEEKKHLTLRRAELDDE